MNLLAAIASALFATDGGAPTQTPVPAPAQTTPPAPSLLAPRPPPRPVSDTYVLRPAKDGTGDLVYEGNVFTARVAPDGSVAFSDRPGIRLMWPLTARRFTFAVPSLQSSLSALVRGKDPPPPQPPDERLPPPETTQLIPEMSRYHADPREGCRECKNMPFRPMAVGVVGRFDITDEIMRMNGKDPYRYEKARFLVATREQRAGMAVRRHATNVRRAHAELPAMLAAIACDDRMSRTDRLAILNALRNDMDLASADGRDAAVGIDAAIAKYLGPADAGTACPPAR